MNLFLGSKVRVDRGDSQGGSVPSHCLLREVRGQAKMNNPERKMTPRILLLSLGQRSPFHSWFTRSSQPPPPTDINYIVPYLLRQGLY